jgi:hypothetical protein
MTRCILFRFILLGVFCFFQNCASARLISESELNKNPCHVLALLAEPRTNSRDELVPPTVKSATQTSLAEELRQDLTSIATSPNLRSKDVAGLLKRVALSPAESRSELTTLHTWVGNERATLSSLENLANWDTLSVGSLEKVLASNPRLLPFRKAWDGLDTNVRRRESYSGRTEPELISMIEGERRKFLSEFCSWGRNLDSRVAHLSQLEGEISALMQKTDIDLYSYLEVFSSYINHFGFEPSEVWRSGNSMFPTSVNPLRFTIHDLLEREDVFPNAIYLPTTKTFSLEEFNDRFSAGIYPVGVVRGGKTLPADGTEFLSTHIIAAHDLTHLPLMASQRSPALLDAKQIEVNSRTRQEFKILINSSEYKDSDAFSDRMEALYFFFFREREMSIRDFVDGGKIPDRLISEMLEENEHGNFDLLLKGKKFKSEAEIVSYIDKMKAIMRKAREIAVR